MTAESIQLTAAHRRTTPACVVHLAWLGDDPDESEVAAVPTARFGCLCGACYGRIRSKLRQAPELMWVIRSQVTPSMQAASYGDKVTGSRDPRLPFREQAVEDADDLFSQFANYLLSFAATIGSVGPYAALPWDGTESGAVRLPPFSLSPEKAAEAMWTLHDWWVKRDVRILTAADPEDVRSWHAEVCDYINVLSNRYQLSEKKSRTTLARMCPACGEARMTVEYFAVETKVRCPHCGYEIVGPEQERFVNWEDPTTPVLRSRECDLGRHKKCESFHCGCDCHNTTA